MNRKNSYFECKWNFKFNFNLIIIVILYKFEYQNFFWLDISITININNQDIIVNDFHGDDFVQIYSFRLLSIDVRIQLFSRVSRYYRFGSNNMAAFVELMKGWNYVFMFEIMCSWIDDWEINNYFLCFTLVLYSLEFEFLICMIWKRINEIISSEIIFIKNFLSANFDLL